MELACAIVLTFVTAVSAVPHGYGAIGGAGAAAKAQASATAGAFSGLGALPLSIPSGAGFSGSFSKSSSSSFASSSASSSSGSFSFSGSGTAGLNGVGANNYGTTGNGGCGSGGCNGLNGVGSNNFGNGGCASGECKYSSDGANNSPKVYNGANSGAIAQAGATAQSGVIAGSPNYPKSGNQPCTGDCGNLKPSNCKGIGCNDLSNSPTSCASGQCAENSPLNNPSHNNEPKNTVADGASPGDNLSCIDGKCESDTKTGVSAAQFGFSNNKCTSGKCDTIPQTSSSSSTPVSEISPSNNVGSNDIPARVTGPSSSKPGHATSYHSSLYGDTADSSAFSNTKPIFNTNPSISSQNKSPNYNKPSIDLSTPKEGPACTSANCQSAQGNKPGQTYLTPANSANNVPNNGAFPNYGLGVSKPGCSGGNCFNVQTNIPTTYPTGPSSCTSGNCGGHPFGQPTGFRDSESKAPNHQINVNHGFSSSLPTNLKILIPNTATYYQNSPESCISGNCGNHPAQQFSNNPSIQPTGYSTSDLKNPSYSQNTTPTSQMNCGSGNCNGNPTQQPSGYAVSGSQHLSNPQGFYPNAVLNCGSGNCGSYPSAPTTGFGETGSKIPTYFQDKSPTDQQNCVSGKCSNVPSLAPIGYTPTNSQKISPNGPVNCVSGNCDDYSSTPPSEYNASRSKYPNHPQGINPNAPVNCASGNCGTSPSTQPTAFHAVGANTAANQNCATGKCESYPISITTPVNTQGSKYPDSGSQSISHSNTPTNCAFGKCDNYPSTQSVNTASKVPQLGGYSPIRPENCATGNCDVPNNSQESFPAFVPLKPTGMKYNNDLVEAKPNNLGHKPTNIPSHGLNFNNAASTTNGAYSTSSTSNFNDNISSSKNGPAYTGGFGGPPGILNPNNFDAPPPEGFVPTNDNKPESIKTGNSEINKSASCSSGVCDLLSNKDESKYNSNHATSPGNSISIHSPQIGQTQISTGINAAAAAATASSDAVAYSGGFGGPPGLLKPYDHGKIHSSDLPINGKPSIASTQFGANYGGNKGAHSSYDDKINGNQGSIAQAGSFAGAAAGAFGNGHFGAQNKGNNGCGGGCGSAGNGAYDSNLNLGLSGGLGLSKFGLLDGLHSGLSAAGAAAKSAAGALSGANAGSFGVAGSFASSAASAHASSGSATKGGYGR
ncbi:LOW QUALITY PROTEIN: wing disc-specific protein [Aphomia sociella]